MSIACSVCTLASELNEYYNVNHGAYSIPDRQMTSYVKKDKTKIKIKV
jgi:hypothetical protein